MDNNSLNNSIDPHIERRFGRGVLWTALVLLSILTLISAALLTVRLTGYVKRDDSEVLLQSNFDKQLEIFSVRYNNESGELVVSGANGQSVIAPGTKAEYTVRLRNKDNVAINYELVPRVSYTSEHVVPVLFRMIDDDGNYLIGDAKTWIAAEDIGQISELGTLVKGDSTEYVLQWKWKFESDDDEYDTFLGNFVKDENIGITVGFELNAEENTDIGANGGVIRSGLADIIADGLTLTLLIASIVLIMICLVKKHKAVPNRIDKSINRDTEEDNGEDI